MLIEEEAVPRRLLLVLHLMPEHADVLNSLLLILLMLTAKPRNLILEEAVLHSLLLVLHSLFHVGTENAEVLHSLFLLLMLTETPTDMMADDADVDVDVVLMRSLLLMPRSLRHMLNGLLLVPRSLLLVVLNGLLLVVLNGLLLVPRSLLLVLQMFRANASSQEYSCKGRGF